jgi:hypothetical protein
MSNANDRVSNGWCLAHEDGTMMVVYLIDGGTASIDLAGSTGTTYTSKWFNPRRGGALQDGSVRSLNVGGTRLLGNAPNGAPGDWVVLITLDAASVTPNPVNQPTTSPVVSPIPKFTKPLVVNSSSVPTPPFAGSVTVPIRAPTTTTPVLAPTHLPIASLSISTPMVSSRSVGPSVIRGDVLSNVPTSDRPTDVPCYLPMRNLPSAVLFPDS